MCNKAVFYLLPPVLMVASSIAQATGEANGVLQWEQKTSLSLPVSGVVKTINVTPGQRVSKGTILLTLDKRPFQYQLQSAKSRMAQYEPGRDEARNELERAEELYERTVLSQVELDQAEMNFAEKNARYLEAGASVDKAELDLEHAELKAPFDLIVLKNHVVAGQTVINRLQATPLITVAGGQLVAVMSLPPGNNTGLKIGSNVDISIAGKTHSGKVKVIDYDSSVDVARIVILIDDQPDAAVGQLVRITW